MEESRHHAPAPVAPVAPTEIRPLTQDEDFDACAAMMAASDPWLRLGLSAPSCRRALTDPEREAWGAWHGERLAGFLVLSFKGAFVGYVQLLGVAPEMRDQGIGAALVEHAERCIFERTRNVFICVSSFNEAAQRFYARLGYRTVGRLENFLVEGLDELLLRKTRGPLLGSDRAGPDAPDAPPHPTLKET
jgi:ribosomal protein S18 acetylase RimI-like enzyme